MSITAMQDKMVRTVFKNNLGDPIENIIDNHPKVFDNIKVDEDFGEYIGKIYDEVNNNDSEVLNDPPDDKAESYAGNTTDMLTTMMETIHAQQEINAEQEKKITDVSGKVDDLVKFIKDIMDHPEQILQTLQSGKAPQPAQPAPGQTKEQSISGLNAQSQAGQTSSGFTMDKISDILGLVAQLKGIDSSRQASQADPLSSMTNGLQMATQLAGALGGALSKMFDAFDGMQNKAYNSWGKRFTGKTIDLSKQDASAVDVEELSKKIAEKIRKGGE